MLEIKKRDGLGRICLLRTAHGELETPALAPVVNPNRMTILPRDMKDKFGVSLVITNAYIIRNNPDLRSEAKDRGIHSLLDFEGPIMTDSGTFQSHVYGEIDVDNLEIVRFQRDIGSDFSTILDVFSEPDEPWKDAEMAVQKTLRRAKDARDTHPDLSLVGPIQGSTYPDLREKSAERISSMDFAIYAIGGVVPLMENYRFSDLVDVVIHSKMKLDPSKPVHLFGAGHPMMFPLAVAMGCDLFDSSSYAKFAADGRMLFPDGTRKIEELSYSICNCPVCSNFDLEELKRNPAKLAEHNLHACQREIQKVKQAIYEGNLLEHVERRSRVHPYLIQAVERLYSYSSFLERYENTSRRGGFFLTGRLSLFRPAAERLRDRVMMNYSLPECDVVVNLPEAPRPFFAHYSELIDTILTKTKAAFVVNSVLGPVPIELDEVYPVAQAVVPTAYAENVRETTDRWMERFLLFHGAPPSYTIKGKESVDLLPASSSTVASPNWDLEKIRRVADYQFGLGAGAALTDGEIQIVKSKTTGKIRNVFLNGVHILSMRAHDGLFTLKLEGAKIFHRIFPPPKMRIVVDAEASEFVRAGRNVFAKFVTDCDDELRPMDEALVVDEEDSLLAVARTLMNREEMLAFERGIAARVRESLPETSSR
ncbi:MAG: tRNA guanosine(15) transglycosylase TgtA [Thermoplasmata archaeon]